MREKSILLAVLAGVVAVSIMSCKGGKTQEPDATQDSVAADTLVTDTLEAEIAAAPMPRAADELFDDFFFNFAGNSRLQRRRIQFPLAQERDGHADESVAAADWQVDHFFMKQEYYTLILDNRRSLDAVKDTAVAHVVVEKIGLDGGRVKQYVFDRIRGLWMLTRIRRVALTAHPEADFLGFYRRFSADSLYQARSIGEQVTFTAPDPDDDFSNITGTMAPEQWPMFRPALIPGGTIYNIVYGKRTGRDSHTRIFMVRGIANGLEMEMTFRKEGDEWHLTEFAC